MKKLFFILVLFFSLFVSNCDKGTDPSERTGAVCKDGTTSTATGSGACSGHGGVDHWLYK